MTTVKELFEAMPASFKKESAAGMSTAIQFDITGEGGGRWYAAIENGELTVAEGTHENPSLVIAAAAQDYIDIGTGKLNAQLAFMTGRIRATGDLRLAMKMPSIFKK